MAFSTGVPPLVPRLPIFRKAAFTVGATYLAVSETIDSDRAPVV